MHFYPAFGQNPYRKQRTMTLENAQRSLTPQLSVLRSSLLRRMDRGAAEISAQRAEARGSSIDLKGKNGPQGVTQDSVIERLILSVSREA